MTEQGHNAIRSARAAAERGDLEIADDFLAAAALCHQDAMLLDPKKYDDEACFQVYLYKLSGDANVSCPDLLQYIVASVPAFAIVFTALLPILNLPISNDYDGVQLPMATVLQPTEPNTK